LKDSSTRNSQKLENIVDSTKKLYDYISIQQVINKFYQNIGVPNITSTSPNAANIMP